MKMFDVYPLNDICIVRAEGSYVWDDKGTRYLDMYGGHAVISIGHTRREYVEAVTRQLEQIGFYSNSVIIARQRELAEKLGRLSGKTDYQLFLCNSGAEANENAMKLASFHNGRSLVVAFTGAFHGRTSLAVSATDNPKIVAPVNRTDHVVFLPFNDTEALEKFFAGRGGEVSSVIVEGIQGVGGIRVASPEFLQAIRRLCDRYGAVYIADSVQCGCGRSGKYYSHDWAGVDADIYTMAKGIGNGFPIGAISIAPHIAPTYGMLGTTFGGNHLACAAAIAVAEVIGRDGLIENVAEIGGYLMERLRSLPGIAEVRGRGLMIGIELPVETAPLRKKLLFDEHVFVGSSGTKVIRLLPALNITREHADRFLAAFEKVLKESGN
ncbi:aspartate aminotransferase family protein [Gallalistipes aquisgranensis]|uniref:aspartate aminotransferase family protein n=1 Tax=Gallalistipes aquisgranensis TaxID=2779358 RepID=UPI001CF896FD|nr:aminotransferase class III-fold pyridoxal phosphate-dependent enzyme [Gallalistipes aquisgranensis]MBE5033572.1 aspartate aminotransferase family protein [Gallalistipes aquisgranensis]